MMVAGGAHERHGSISLEQRMMRYIGIVNHGVVVLPPEAHLEEGERVQVIPASVSPGEAFLLHESASPCPAVGTLPDDLAANHDYYLHGLRKQQPRCGRWMPAGEPARELTAQEALTSPSNSAAWPPRRAICRLISPRTTTTICTACLNHESRIR
jgi:hypothetical protein